MQSGPTLFRTFMARSLGVHARTNCADLENCLRIGKARRAVPEHSNNREVWLLAMCCPNRLRRTKKRRCSRRSASVTDDFEKSNDAFVCKNPCEHENSGQVEFEPNCAAGEEQRQEELPFEKTTQFVMPHRESVQYWNLEPAQTATTT